MSLLIHGIISEGQAGRPSQWFLISCYQEHELRHNTGSLWSQILRQSERQKRMEMGLDKTPKRSHHICRITLTRAWILSWTLSHVYTHSFSMHILHDNNLWWSNYRVSPQRLSTIVYLCEEQTVSSVMQHVTEHATFICYVCWTKCFQWIPEKTT